MRERGLHFQTSISPKALDSSANNERVARQWSGPYRRLPHSLTALHIRHQQNANQCGHRKDQVSFGKRKQSSMTSSTLVLKLCRNRFPFIFYIFMASPAVSLTYMNGTLQVFSEGILRISLRPLTPNMPRGRPPSDSASGARSSGIETRAVCPMCERTFRSIDNAKIHARNEHAISVRDVSVKSVFLCAQCQRNLGPAVETDHLSSEEHRLATTTARKRYKGQHCTKAYSRVQYRDGHEKTHATRPATRPFTSSFVSEPAPEHREFVSLVEMGICR